MGCALIRNRFEHNFAASNVRDSNERSNVGTFVQALLLWSKRLQGIQWGSKTGTRHLSVLQISIPFERCVMRTRND